MSSNLNTPLSVLMAPELTPLDVHIHAGLNRSERRHPETVSAKRRLSASKRIDRPFVGNVRRDVLGIVPRIPRHTRKG